MPIISLFKGGVSNVKNPTPIELVTALEKIRDGEWQDEVSQCRLIKDKKERDAFKDKMTRITFSGEFSYRNDSGLKEHSGVIALDLDDLENVNIVKDMLIKDKYVFACFVSVSGYGLRVIFRINQAKHRESFLGLKIYLFKEYGQVLDVNSSVSKPYIVSFDPELFMRYDLDDVPIFKKYPPAEPQKKVTNLVHTNDDFERVVKEIVDRKINMLEDYYDYVKVGLAIAKTYGEAGKENFHRISQFGTKYSFKNTEKEYKYFCRQTGSEQANIATFYYFAKMHGVKITSDRTKTIVRRTRIGKGAGLKPEQIAENLKKYDEIDDSLEIVKQIFDNDPEDDEKDTLILELEAFVSHNYSLRMNEITGHLEQKGSVLTDNDINSIFIAAKKQIPFLDFQLMKRLFNSDFIPKYNPFFEFFGSDGIPVELPAIPVQDNKEYDSPLIDKLAKTIINDDPEYTRYFLKKWLVSMISSAHKVHSPLLLCLLGGQNLGKTEWFRRLLPKELQSYYAESKLDKGKDDEILMAENILIVDDEMGGKSKQDNIKLKNITSAQYYYLRRPYGDHNEKIVRLALLGGSSNTRAIMGDSTGNRRIIPVEVKDIDKELYNSINKKDLFMEIYSIYKSGFDWRISGDDIFYLNKDYERYEIVVAERELIERYFTPMDDKRMSTTDIKVELELLTKQKLNPNAIGRELENAGFERKSTRLGNNKTPKLWCVGRINRQTETINTNSSIYF